MPHDYPKLCYFYRALFFLAVVFGLLLILSALIYFSILPSALLFLGWVVSPIPFFSPAWYLLTFMTVLLLGIATGTVIHRQQLIAEKQENLTKEVNNRAQLIELKQEVIEERTARIIENLKGLKQHVNKIEPQNTDFLQKIDKLILEVTSVGNRAEGEQNQIAAVFETYIEKLNHFDVRVGNEKAQLFVKKAKMMALEREVDEIRYQNETKNASQAPVMTTPYLDSTLFRNTVMRDYQENTNLSSQSRI